MSRSKSKERTYTSARERAEKQGIGFTASYLKVPDGVQFFKPKSGTMLLDILPFVAGKGNPWADKGMMHWERTYYAHRGVGANNDTFLCPRMTRKEKCPICEFRASLMKKGDDENEQLIKDLAPKQRQLFNVINLKDPDKGVQIWDFSYFLFGKVLDARLRNSDEEDGWDKFFFLEDGLTLKVGFAEKSFGGVSFCEVETIDFKSRREQYDEDILEKVHRLDDLLIVPDYKDLKDAFLEAKEKGKDDDDDDDEDDDEEEDAPAKRSARKASKPPKPVDDDEDEEEDEDDDPPFRSKKSKPMDDEDEEDDDDEEEASPPKKRKPSKPVDDDDDDDDDDDEDDEPPKKSKKSVKDDWDDFDEDEEEEEAPPKKKSKR